MPRSDTFETLQVPSELEQMVALYRQERPARVLEIGCWDGGTLKVWLQEAEPELVVAVDLWHRNSDAYEEWRKPATVLRLFTGQSQEQDQVGSMQAHAPYDWAFVDGDHGDWGAREDVRNVLPLVRPGGLLLLHDITPPAGEQSYPPGVIFDEFGQAGYETWAFQDLTPAPWSRGIGVVRIPA